MALQTGLVEMNIDGLKLIAGDLAREQLQDLEYLTIAELYDGELTDEEMYRVLNLVTNAMVII
jgi:hypothetical protein